LGVCVCVCVCIIHTIYVLYACICVTPPYWILAPVCVRRHQGQTNRYCTLFKCVCLCVRPPRTPFAARCIILVEYPPLQLLPYYIYVNITRILYFMKKQYHIYILLLNVYIGILIIYYISLR